MATPARLAAGHEAKKPADPDHDGPPTVDRPTPDEPTRSGVAPAETIAFIAALVAVVVLVALL